MKLTKKFISAVLILVLTISAIAVPSVTASAANVQYSGSPEYMSSVYYDRLSKVKLTGNQADDIINIASSQLGYHEGSAPKELNGENKRGELNYTEYNLWFYEVERNEYTPGGEKYPYCAVFVSFCKNLASQSTGRQIFPNFSGCSTAVRNFDGGSWKSYGVFHSDTLNNGTSNYIPHQGDLVFFANPKSFQAGNYFKIVNEESIGQVTHVGIVAEDAKTSTGSFVTIEGNYDNSVSRVTRDHSNVVGFFTPNYNKTDSVGLERIHVSSPKNIDNAWIAYEDLSDSSISWNAVPDAVSYEYTIREQKFNPTTGKYIETENYLCSNVSTKERQISLKDMRMTPESAWKCWIGTRNSSGALIAETFVYIRICPAENSSVPETVCPSDPDTTPSASAPSYNDPDPLPGQGWQVERDDTATIQPDSGNVSQDPEPKPDSGHGNVSDTPVETPPSSDDAPDGNDDVISKLNYIIKILQAILAFFGISI